MLSPAATANGTAVHGCNRCWCSNRKLDKAAPALGYGGDSNLTPAEFFPSVNCLTPLGRPLSHTIGRGRMDRPCEKFGGKHDEIAVYSGNSCTATMPASKERLYRPNDEDGKDCHSIVDRPRFGIWHCTGRDLLQAYAVSGCHQAGSNDCSGRSGRRLSYPRIRQLDGRCWPVKASGRKSGCQR
jgi:hypothetical protein